MKNVTYYLTASSRQFGAIGIFHVYGPETILIDALDRRVGGRDGSEKHNSLRDTELCYGWLRDVSGGVIDEVMLARPFSGMRVLMTHGGHVIREKIIHIFTIDGFADILAYPDSHGVASFDGDSMYDPVLASCVTQAQVAAVLEARDKASRDGAPVRLPENLLLTRRLLLAGPPNAGKSSLLNNLAEHERAFVHHEAGATTDVVDELVDMGGYAVLVGDMPGFDRDSDELGREAWARAAERLRLADAVLFVCDGSRDWDAATADAAREVAATLRGKAGEGRVGLVPVLVVVNKSDRPPVIKGEPWRTFFPEARAVRVCSLPDGDAALVLSEMAAGLFGA